MTLAPPGNPERSLHFNVHYFNHFCEAPPVREGWHIHRFWGVGRGHRWEVIIQLTTCFVDRVHDSPSWIQMLLLAQALEVPDKYAANPQVSECWDPRFGPSLASEQCLAAGSGWAQGNTAQRMVRSQALGLAHRSASLLDTHGAWLLQSLSHSCSAGSQAIFSPSPCPLDSLPLAWDQLFFLFFPFTLPDLEHPTLPLPTMDSWVPSSRNFCSPDCSWQSPAHCHKIIWHPQPQVPQPSFFLSLIQPVLSFA